MFLCHLLSFNFSLQIRRWCIANSWVGIICAILHYRRSDLTRFAGVIKGSEEVIKHNSGYLDRKTYLALSHRQNSTFANQRDVVYNLFKAYLKRKRETGDYDVADRFLTSCLVCLYELLKLAAGPA